MLLEATPGPLPTLTGLASIGSRRPSHLGTCLGARDFRLSDLLCEHLLESVGDAIRRTTFYDCSVGQAMAQQLGKTSWPREADIVR